MVKARTFGYFFSSAGRSLVRNSWMTIASISTVAIALLVLGVFLLVAVNVNVITEHMESQIEITAYLREIDSNELLRLQNEISAMSGVSVVEHITRDEAWQRLLEWYGNDRSFLAGWDEDNPLRDSLEIRVDNPGQATEVAVRVSGLSGIEEVVYGREIVEQLLVITRMIRLIGIGIMVGLALAAMFIIANTIRITVFARRREISIMRYVGATNWFIRWPFVIEGWVLGLTGALLASSILAWGYFYAVRYLVSAVPFWPLVAPWPFLQQMALLLMAIGSFIGICGSGVSIRRYLNA
jgi:cell division transport system permease protein